MQKVFFHNGGRLRSLSLTDGSLPVIGWSV